ncbi:MAG: ATP phosphoribosyltransferase regulatory subunit, partial [Myxococcota bacterium]
MSEYLYTTPPLDRSVGLRRRIMSSAMGTFGGWGYREIQVPMLHFFEALKPGLDADQIERSFRFVDRDGNLMVLRPDVTPAIAQMFAYQIRAPELPLRVSYTHKVVRIERTFTRNELETYQLGIEHIGGADELASDLEVLILAMRTLDSIGLPDWRVNLADHRIAHMLLKATGAPHVRREEIRRAVIARDADEVRAVLNRLGARAHHRDALIALTSNSGGTEQLDVLTQIFEGRREELKRLNHVRSIHATLEELGMADRVDVELGEIDGASYYTGIGFTLVSQGAPR